jgi:DNA polymerase-1
MPPHPDAKACLALARCSECPLGATLARQGTWSPVEAELHAGTTTVIVGPAPEKQDVVENAPFLGPDGATVMEMLREVKVRRKDVSWTHAVACRYPNDDVKSFNAQLEGRIRRIRAKNDRALREWTQAAEKARRQGVVLPRPELTPIPPTPAVACRPRLEAELARFENVLSLGTTTIGALGVTLETADGRKQVIAEPKLGSFRGAPARTANGQKLLATRLDMKSNPMWRPVVLADLQRAFRYFSGQSEWREPRMITKPTPTSLRALLARFRARGKPVVYDVETTNYAVNDKGTRIFDALFDPLRCLAFGNQGVAVVVPFLSVDGATRFYPPAVEAEIRQILADEFFADTTIPKVGHNAGYYDRLVVEEHFGVTPAPLYDTMLVHKLADAEYPHGLGFLGSIWTDAPAWKSEHTATEATTDLELWTYNGRDIAVTDRVLVPAVARAKAQGQAQLYGTYARLQDVCVNVHRIGVHCDEPRRQWHQARLEDAMAQHQAELRGLGVEINPRSHVAVRALLFEKWGLPALELTDSGEASTNDRHLRALYGNPLCKEDQKEVIHHVRKYRQAATLLSNFIWKWAPNAGFVQPNGWLHPDFNASGTVGWRWASSNPNFQNVPYELRDCFDAGEGYEFVYADYDQIELRLVAALAEATYYLDAFTTGSIDAHNLTGKLVFGDAYWRIPGAPADPRLKGEGAFKVRRDLVKRIVYASLYKAAAPTVHSVVSDAEDDAGRPIDVELAEVRAIHRRWLRAAPEFAQWWANVIAERQRQGYLAEPIWGLRRFFANYTRKSENEVINWKAQAGGGAIVHTGMFRALKELPFDHRTREGLCLQVHDSLVFRVRKERSDEALAVLRDRLPVHALGMNFTIEADRSSRLALHKTLDAQEIAQRKATP